MRSDWITTSVSDIAAPQRNAIVGGPFGSDLVSKDYVPFGVPVIRGQNLSIDRWVTGPYVYVSDEKADRLSSNLAKPGDLVFTQRGNAVLQGGQVAIVPAGKHSRFLISQSQMKLTPDLAKVDAVFLLYVFRSQHHAEYLRNNAVVTGVPHTNLGLLRTYSFKLPSLNEQRRIANILGTLDDKIELNRQMNETLEAMARRLFKSWFVDFDPVHAKAALRREHPRLSNADLSRRALPNMAPEIAELFPDGFEESVLGAIPKGWRTRSLYEIARFVNGAAFKNSDFCDSSIGKPVIKIAELKSGIDSQTKYSQKDVGPDRTIRRGDILYSWSGSPDTSLATFRWTGREGLLNQHIFKVITKTRPEEIIAYYQLTELRDTLVQIARNKQTTGLGHVTVEDMKRLQVVQPASEVVKAFAESIAAVYDQSFNLTVDALQLERTRDKLLPNLLAGTLTLTD